MSGPTRLSRVLQRSRAAARRFGAETSGIAAVEFAMILPAMVLFYLGTVQVTRIVTVDSKVSSVADTVGDLVARLKTIDDTSMKNIFAISSAIMNPYKLDDLRMVVTAVNVDVNGKGTIDWQKASKGTQAASGTPYTLPNDLAAYKDTYFIVSSAAYQYTPTIKFMGSLGERTFAYDSTYRPRKSLEITPPTKWRS